MIVWLLIASSWNATAFVVPQLPTKDECVRLGRLIQQTGYKDQDKGYRCIEYTTAGSGK